MELPHTIFEMKHTLAGITRRLDEAKDQVSKLKDKIERNTQVQQKHKRKDSKTMGLP